jgi:nucleotide-binding universal stress UspA family protein
MIETIYSKILVGVDGSKESMKAVDHAIGLAKKDNSELICMTALQLPSFYGWSAIEPPEASKKKDKLGREEWINNIIKTAKENNLKIKDKTVESPMSADGAIVNYADNENVDNCCRYKRKVRVFKEAAWKCCLRSCDTCIMSCYSCKIIY